jgi:hypothetical protein
MNKKQLQQKLNPIDKKLKCAEKTVTATRKKLIAAKAYCKMLASLALGRSRSRSRSLSSRSRSCSHSRSRSHMHMPILHSLSIMCYKTLIHNMDVGCSLKLFAASTITSQRHSALALPLFSKTAPCHLQHYNALLRCPSTDYQGAITFCIHMTWMWDAFNEEWGSGGALTTT